MPIITRLSDKKILIIDDLPGMRSQLLASLSALGFERMNIAGNIRDAMTRLAEVRYDVILCDYYLGEATSGQQFLEHIRAKQVVPPSTLFIMITAENGYESVMRAAEWAPDDYLIKPFTAAQFEARLLQLLDKRERLSAVNAAIEKGALRQAIDACDSIISAKDKYLVDAVKLKGGLLLKIGAYAQAQAVYQSILDMRPVGWAQLGLARALKAQNAHAEAETILESLILDNRHMMGAYDTLAEVLSATDREAQAMSTLQRAMEVSPGTVSRTRNLGKLALATGNIEVAEKTVRTLLSQHQHSPLKEAGDFLMAASIYSAAGRPDEALSVVKSARTAFKEDTDRHTLTVAEVTAHLAMGNGDAAASALKNVQGVSPSALDPATATALGKALYAAGDDAAGRQLLRQLVQENPDDAELIRAVRATLSTVGKGDEASALIDASIQEVVNENNDGVKLAKEGQLEEAIEKLTDASARLPGNLQILSNAALVLALSLGKSNPARERVRVCLEYRKKLLERDPYHPKLAQIDALLTQTKNAQS